MHNECQLLQEPDTEQYVSALIDRILTHIGEPPVEAVPDSDALAQPQPEYVFDQQVQW